MSKSEIWNRRDYYTYLTQNDVIEFYFFFSRYGNFISYVYVFSYSYFKLFNYIGNFTRIGISLLWSQFLTMRYIGWNFNDKKNRWYVAEITASDRNCTGRDRIELLTYFPVFHSIFTSWHAIALHVLAASFDDSRSIREPALTKNTISVSTVTSSSFSLWSFCKIYIAWLLKELLTLDKKTCLQWETFLKHMDFSEM